MASKGEQQKELGLAIMFTVALGLANTHTHTIGSRTWLSDYGLKALIGCKRMIDDVID